MKRISLTLATSAFALVAASCGDNTPAPPPPPPPVPNAAPVITSAAAATVPERSVQPFYTATATDAENSAITFSISGGADAALFTLSASNTIAFTNAADFENPADANQDNIYEIVLNASDGQASTTRTVQITVTDVTNTPMRTTRVALGFDRPLFATGSGDGSNRLFIVEQRGLIRIVDLANGNAIPADPFLDVAADLSMGGEQGLLGLAFAPDYATSGLFYIYITNTAGNSQVFEYRVDANNPNRANPSSRRLILAFDQPFANHNGGWMAFGPDGFLYISSGDGGGAGDPNDNGQNINTLLGAILRINPSADDFPNDVNANYAIPATNPFVNAAGADEIFAYGLRNPFRASFDSETGNLYIGDVGQGRIEEIDLIPAGTNGQNFGWKILEGTRDFSAGSTAGLVPPIAEYPHENSPIGGFSVTGGYVHRGSVEALIANYVFADFVSGNIWRIPVSNITQGTTIAAANFVNITAGITPPNFGTIGNISSFGVDDNGELYIVDLFRGEVFRIENDE